MDDIMTTSSVPGTPIAVNQDGEKNVFLNNTEGGVVNINVNQPPQPPVISAEQIIAIQNFSKQYYQLIVTTDPEIFTSNIITVPAGRALTEYLVPEEIFQRCSSLSDSGKQELMTFPAIICMENEQMNAVCGDAQLAMYCYLKKITLYRREIKIVFQPIATFKQSVLCDHKNAIFFGLRMDCAMTDLNHSAWSVHKENLFDAFKAAGLTGMPCPQ